MHVYTSKTFMFGDNKEQEEEKILFEVIVKENILTVVVKFAPATTRYNT